MIDEAQGTHYLQQYVESRNSKKSISSANPLTGANLVPIRHSGSFNRRFVHRQWQQKLVFSMLEHRSSLDFLNSRANPAKNTEFKFGFEFTS